MKRLVYATLLGLLVGSLAFATDIKSLIGKEDINFGSGSFDRRTSTGSTITLNKVNDTAIPISNQTGSFLDYLFHSGHALTIYPANITGDNTGRVQGYSFGSSSYTDNGYFKDIRTKGPWVDVRAYGATGNGTTDDTAAIQAALDAITSSGVAYFPSGTYAVSSPLTITNKTITLKGDGKGVSILKWTSTVPTGGISGSFNAETQKITILGLTLQTSVAGGGTAIYLSWAADSSSSYPHSIINDVELAGSTAGTYYWDNGVVLDNAWNSRVSGLVSIGSPSPTFGSTAAVQLLGTSMDTIVKDFHIFHGQYGIRVAGTTEGPQISNGIIVGSQYGIDLSTTSPEPGHSISNVHTNTFNIGINLDGRTDTFITGNLIYKFSTSSQNWIGIKSGAAGNGSDRVRIIGNCIIGGGAGGTDNGIQLAGATYNVVTGNQLSTLANGVVLQAVTGYALVTGNDLVSVTTSFVNSGYGNLINNNTPTYSLGLGIGDIVLPYEANIQYVNQTDNALLSAVQYTKEVAGNQLIKLGGGYSGGAYTNIVGGTTGTLPGGSSTVNGIITINTSDNTFIYYVNGARFKLTGTGF